MNCCYNNKAFLLQVRRIVKYFNWKKITIMGHSLGGAIGFLYSGIFPDEVSKLISIDIVSPTIREVSFQSDNAARIVEQFLKYETFTEANMPCYSYEVCITYLITLLLQINYLFLIY